MKNKSEMKLRLLSSSRMRVSVGLGPHAQDLLRAFVRVRQATKQKIQKVYSSCKESSRVHISTSESKILLDSRLRGNDIRGFGLLAIIVSLLGLPNVSFAQGLGASFRDIVLSIVKVLSDDIIPIMTAIAFLIVLYNLTMFVFKADNETERGYFKTYTIWSLIAFFVLLTVFAIVKIFHTSIFGGSTIGIPQFQSAR